MALDIQISGNISSLSKTGWTSCSHHQAPYVVPPAGSLSVEELPRFEHLFAVFIVLQK